MKMPLWCVCDAFEMALLPATMSCRGMGEGEEEEKE